jgi:VWFA-related protein
MVQLQRTTWSRRGGGVLKTLTKLSLAAILLTCSGLLATAQNGASKDDLRIKTGAKIMLDLDTGINSATAREDDIVWFTVRNDVKTDGQVAIPRGTPIRGSIIVVKPAAVNGKNQRTEIQIRLEELPLSEGGTLAVVADVLKVQGEKAGGAAPGGAIQGAVGAASQGAMAGGMISRSGKGAAIGAIAGVAVGVIAEIVTPDGPSSDVDLPPGSVFEAKLQRPLDIPINVLLARTIPKPAAPAGAPAADSQSAAVLAMPDRSSTASIEAKESTEAAQPAVPALESLETAESVPVPADGTAVPAGATPATLSVDVNLVQVDAIVRDRSGKPMSNLRQGDFRVFEDGVEQRIQFFSRDQLPLAVALVIDRSGSVAPLMPQVQAAAYQALQLLKAGDQVALFTFAGSVEMLEELTPSRQRVANRIGNITAGGGTAIVDAVAEALRYLDTAAPDRRGAVILISDNVDGRNIVPVNQAIELALETEAVIYSVKVGAGGGGLFGIPGIPGLPAPRIPGLGGDDPVPALTKETGGEIFDATGTGSIGTALTMAVDRLKLRYTLSYASQTAGAARSEKGGYHRIEVRLVDRFGRPDADYTVNARSGYYDPPTGPPRR